MSSSSSSLTHPLHLLLISSLLLLSSVFVTGFLPQPPSTTTNTARATRRARRRNKLSKEFLQAHNVARIASGASSLKWDEGLARFANDWARKLKPNCKMDHSNGPHGENIFWYKRSENWSPKRVVETWVEESLNYDRITNTCKLGKMCGHYTQIIWRSTTAVGCGLTRCDNGLGFLVVCEYSPQGNYEGESP